MRFAKRTIAWLLVLAHLASCAANPPMPVVSEAQRKSFGVVGIGSITQAPVADLGVYARGRTSGAARGAGEGAAAGAAAFMGSGSSCSGAVCGVAILLLPVFVVGGAVVGAVAGAGAAVPDDKARTIEAQLDSVLKDAGQQEALRVDVLKAAHRSRVPNVSAINSNVDTVLEVGLVRVGLLGQGGEDPILVLRVHAVARLVDARTNAELYRNYGFVLGSLPRKYSEWAADGARLLRNELERVRASIAGSIVDDVFLVVRTN